MPAEEDVYETVDLGVPWQRMDTRHLGTPTAEEQAELVEEMGTDPMVVAEEIEA